MQKRDLKSLFVLLFPVLLILPLPLIVSAIATALMIVNLIVLRISNKQKEYFRITSFLILCVLVFFLDGITGILSGKMDSDMIYRGSRASFVFIPLLFSFCAKHLETLKNKILVSFVIGVLLYIVFAYGYLVYFYNFITNRPFVLNHYLKYDLYNYLPFAYHHTYLGLYFCFSILILLYYFQSNKQINKTQRLALSVFVFLNQLFIGGKLTVLLSCLIILHYALNSFFFWKKKQNLPNKIVKFTITFLTGFGFLFVLYRKGLWRTINNSISRRIEIWRCSLNSIGERPFLGWGRKIGQNQIEACGIENVFGTHNQLLEEFLYYGVFGLWFVAFFVILGIKSKKDLMFKQFLFLILIVSLFENVFSLQRGILFIAFFSSMFYFTNLSKGNNAQVFTNE